MNRIIIFQILLALTFYGCKGQADRQKESVEINGVKIEKRIFTEIEEKLEQKPIEFERVNYHYEKVNSTWNEKTDTIRNGFYFKKINDSKAKSMVQKYSDEIIEDGNYLFLTNLDFDDNWNTFYDVTIVKASSQYEVLKIMNSSGPNYDVTNEQVISKMKEWDERVGLKIIVADGARVEALITRLPKNVAKFTKEVYKLCPDVIDQGYGDMDEMIKDYKTNKYFWMWWD